LLGDADVALAPCAVTVTVRTGTRGEMLTSVSQVFSNIGQGYARAIRQTVLGGVTGHYARGHLVIIIENLRGRRRTPPNSRARP
jgi:hypothetical protein